jgi:hypothetical protein
MRLSANVMCALVLALFLTACGQAEFGSGNSDPNAKSSALGQVESNEDGDANGEVHTVADLEADPSLAELYACGRGNEKKVLICHVPPGNPEAAHTLCIGAPALVAHLDNHHASNGDSDALGACTEAKKKRCNSRHSQSEEE